MCVFVFMRAQLLGRVQLFVTPWTVALQAPLSKEFSRQEYWSGLPFPIPVCVCVCVLFNYQESCFCNLVTSFLRT